ncbi:MAG: sigma-70 family RNA polymerase sigma factor [Opitutaceae bacterium]
MDLPQSDQARWFADEVQPHEPLLRAYLQKQFPALSDVDDVVQESHLRLVKAHRLGQIESVKSYLFAIARNVVIGAFRRSRRLAEFPVDEMPAFGVLDETADVAETASVSQEFALATEAIDRLPARCREIVILRALHGCSHQQIAARLGLSDQTVRVQVARGMKKCAQFLRQHGVERPLQS